jgi:3-oxoacyl-(acyl-carrier-protein) synthase
MRRVVVTGMGIVSCLGNDLDTVSRALAEGKSGIRAMPDYAQIGLRAFHRSIWTSWWIDVTVGSWEMPLPSPPFHFHRRSPIAD